MLRCALRFKGEARSRRHRMWVCNRTFAHPAQQIALQTYLNVIEHNEACKTVIEQQIREAITSSPWPKRSRLREH